VKHGSAAEASELGPGRTSSARIKEEIVEEESRRERGNLEKAAASAGNCGCE